jgi:hypothetical protein
MRRWRERGGRTHTKTAKSTVSWRSLAWHSRCRTADVGGAPSRNASGLFKVLLLRAASEAPAPIGVLASEPMLSILPRKRLKRDISCTRGQDRPESGPGSSSGEVALPPDPSSRETCPGLVTYISARCRKQGVIPFTNRVAVLGIYHWACKHLHCVRVLKPRLTTPLNAYWPLLSY